MPRKLAADRYSPEIADAFHQGGTARAATKKSAVVRARRVLKTASPMVMSTTANIASAAETAFMDACYSSSRRAAKRSSLRWARRTYHQPTPKMAGYTSRPRSSHHSGSGPT